MRKLGFNNRINVITSSSGTQFIDPIFVLLGRENIDEIYKDVLNAYRKLEEEKEKESVANP